MKRAKAKATPAFPRRSWVINPITRVKESAKLYVRRKVKQPGLNDLTNE